MFLNKETTWFGRGSKALSLIKGKLLYLLFIVVPFITYPLSINGHTINQRRIREICLFSCSLIICSLLQKNKWLRYFIAWCVANWWLNFFLPQVSRIYLYNLLASLVLYIGLKRLLSADILEYNTILKIICISVLFQCAWVTMQKFNFDPVFYAASNWGERVNIKMPLCGWSGNPALLGVFFSSTIFLFLEYFKVKKIPILFFVVLGFVLLIKSATAIMAITIGGLFYIFNKYSFKGKKILVALSIIILSLSAFYFIKNPNFDRLPIWEKLIKQGIRVRPFVGSGLGIFSNLMIVDKTGTPWFEAHNDYLEMILELGIIGFILFSGFIVSCFKDFSMAYKTNKQICMASCLVAFMVSAISLFPFHITQLSFYAIAMLVCLERTYEVSI